MLGFTIPTTFSAVDKLSAPLRKMSKNMQSFASKSEAGIARLDRRLRKLTPSLGSMGKQMLQFASAGAIIAGIGGAINIVKDYEQANADLSAVMNTTSENQNKLSSDAERLGAITAKSATEVVGLQEAFARLGFPTEDIVNMTEATISGSIAMNAELADTAELTGAMIKTFDDFSSIDAPDILDKMTLATQRSALNFEKLQTALPIVGGAANAAGISFENTLALLGKLSDAGIDASSSSTALRNIFLDSASKGHTYTEVLESIEKNQNKLTAANDEFGKRGAVSASILSKGLSEVAKLTNELTDKTTFQGAAQKAAEKRLNTFGGSLTLLSSAYEGLILDISNSTGALGGMSSIVRFVTDNIKGLATILGVVVGGFIALKLAVVAGQVAMFAYNVVVGVSAVMSATQATSIGASNVAMRSQQIATYAVIAAQWLWTAAMAAFNVVANLNPIGLIVLGVAALIGVVALIINYFDSWGAAFTLVGSIAAAFFSPVIAAFGLVISLVMSFKRNWDMISDAFSNGGISAGIIAIGATLLDSILMPLQQILEIAENFTGFSLGSSAIKSLRAEIGIDTGEEVAPLETLNPEASKQESLTRSITENTNRETLDLNVNVNGGEAEVTGGSSNNVNLKSSMTGGQ